MDFLQLARDRYSVRKFKVDKIEKEKLDLILEAGRVAPTAGNFQPQRVLVIESDESMEQLKTCTPAHFNAPLALLVCYDSNTSWKNTRGLEAGDVDASIVTTHMMLEAASLGLGSTWVGVFDYEKTKGVFNIPDHIVPVALLPLGYPAQDARPDVRHIQKYDLDKTVTYNSF